MRGPKGMKDLMRGNGYCEVSICNQDNSSIRASNRSKVGRCVVKSHKLVSLRRCISPENSVEEEGKRKKRRTGGMTIPPAMAASRQILSLVCRSTAAVCA